MSKAVINNPAKDSTIMWQEVEEGVPEPALLIERYSDVFCIVQGENTININYETIPDLIKVLKQVTPP